MAIINTATKKHCPQCGSEDVAMIGSGAFMCRACGYSGSVHETPLFGGEMKGLAKKKGARKK
jgi:ribosomal protein L37AE/L43A